ncbi:FSIP1 family-domain-containing protein [Entophlyctis helioformis]|nr:FSIP1 family-domain-containing protein [Entophlyctis helioformis]
MGGNDLRAPSRLSSTSSSPSPAPNSLAAQGESRASMLPRGKPFSRPITTSKTCNQTPLQRRGKQTTMTDHESDAGGPEHSSSVDGFLSNIIKRQEQIESTTAAAEAHLVKLKQAVETRNSSLISYELTHADQPADLSQEEREKTEAEIKANEQIRQGLIKIKELDVVLREKLFTARSLKKDRLIRDSATGTPMTSMSSIPSRPYTYHNSLSDDDDDDEDLELRSVHSMDMDTFITEPKMMLRPKVGRQALESSGKATLKRGDQADDGSGGHAGKAKKGYKQGDFIERNKVLGPDARYYSAMTEEEMDRVNRLLRDEEAADDPSSRAETASEAGESAVSSRPTSTASFGFFPEGADLGQLQDIDSRLADLIPRSEWGAKSLVWSTPSTSGVHTPMTGNWLRSNLHSAMTSASVSSGMHSRSRDIESLLHDTEIPKTAEMFQSDHQRMLAIDEQLRRLKEEEQEEETRPLTREALEYLISQAMHSSAQSHSHRHSRHSSNGSSGSRHHQ